MTVVADSSAVTALLTGSGEVGRWAKETLDADAIVSPSHMPVEVANTLRRSTLRRELSEELAGIAHAELLTLGIELIPYVVLADRAWELRGSISLYDAAYVALAEFLGAPLVTVDRRLSRTRGHRCTFLTP